MRLEAHRAIAFLVSEHNWMVGSGAKKGGRERERERERENEGSGEDNRGFVFLGRDEKKTQSVS